jgi:glycosyltransferase involved in cell wall biosynthesis
VSRRDPPSLGPSPAVSVLIRAYDRPAGLAAAIASALAQTYGDLEIIVSDDSGRLGPVAEGFGDPRVRYFPNPDPAGPAVNLARAARLARGRLLAVLNDDDRWHPSFLARTVPILDNDPAIGVVFTDDLLEVGGRFVRRRLPYSAGRHDAFLQHVLEHSIPPSANVVRRAVFEEGEVRNPLTAGVIGDFTLWLRVANAGAAFYFLDEPLGTSRVHEGQVSWSEQDLATRLIATLAAFRFDDPACEGLRRARLAEALLARTHVHLRRRRLRAAATDLRRARRVAPRRLGLRGLLAVSGLRAPVMRWGSSRPWALVPLLAFWRHVRPPVLPSTADR